MTHGEEPLPALIVSASDAPPKRGPLYTPSLATPSLKSTQPNLPADPVDLPPDPPGIVQLPLSTQLLLPQPTQPALLLLHPPLLQIADDAAATAAATLKQWRFLSNVFAGNTRATSRTSTRPTTVSGRVAARGMDAWIASTHSPQSITSITLISTLWHWIWMA